jgi:hypothetical protein
VKNVTIALSFKKKYQFYLRIVVKLCKNCDQNIAFEEKENFYSKEWSKPQLSA